MLLLYARWSINLVTVDDLGLSLRQNPMSYKKLKRKREILRLSYKYLDMAQSGFEVFGKIKARFFRNSPC